MRITGPQDPRTQGQLPLQPQDGRTLTGSKTDQAPHPTTDTRTPYTGRMPNIPPEQMQALDSELAAIGIERTSLDPAGVYRALQLLQHGIPLSKAAVTLELADMPSVLNDITVLIDEAHQLLDTGNLSAANRTLLIELVGNLDTLFTAPITSGESYIGAIEEWTAGIELRLLALLATGESGETVNDILADAGRYIASEEALSRLGGDAIAILTGYRETAAQFRASIAGIERGVPGAQEQIQSALIRFETALLSLTEYSAGSGTGNLLPVIQELFSRQISLFRDRLLVSPIVPGGSDGANVSGAPAAMIRQSGLMFEWRLFSWYLSGGSPERLRHLMQHDLKGVLLTFLGRLKDRTGGEASKGSLSRIEQQVRSLVNRTQSQQLATLTGRSDQKQPLFFELPIAGQPGSGQARIKLSGERQPSKDNRPRELSLSFAVETSVLGVVHATMNVSGEAVSIEFLLTRDEWAKLGEKQKHEIKERLQTQGFAVGDISFRQLELSDTNRNTEHTE